MPELPEVETIKRGITELTGHTITGLNVRNPNLRYTIDKNLPEKLRGKRVVKISRRGKYLILELDSGFIVIHLGMSGSLTLLNNPDLPLKKHDHFDLLLGSYVLRYNDPRRFGLLIYIKNLADSALLTVMGPEPLEAEFTPDYLLSILKNKKSTIKQLIMDSHNVVGVGNIYACEALFLSKIAPTRAGDSISKSEATRLVKAIKQVLELAITHGGSSLRDYKQADGKMGYFQNIHNVYGRAGEKCVKCGSKIVELRLGQRNSFYCPQCQK